MNARRALLIGLLLLPCWSHAQQPVPEILFNAALVDLAGQPATLARFRGQPLIVNFWARWCGPCRTEIPDLITEYTRVKNTGLQIVGLALDDKPDAVRDFAKAYDIDYPVLLAKDGAIDLLQQLDNPQAGLPYTLAINRRGQVVARKLGPMSRTEMTAAFAAANK
ncbi:MAG: TlpA family protein disulfide reductase [Burkholderiaceae bacterium]|jgi:thiol-disulfide isomerase/thioredoxin|nr:TlpA family protein disulfide reductase [Burkholderiaceae bacterium]